MKKFSFLLVLTAFVMNLAFGKQVDVATAKIVGQNFLNTRTTNAMLKAVTGLELVYTSSALGGTYSDGQINYFYVFNTSPSKGFIIVSSDDKAAPVLGYSYESGFDAGKIPPHVASWLEWYNKEIRAAITDNLVPASDVTNAWLELKKEGRSPVSLKSTKGVAPLMQTQWDQSPYYNALCPFDQQYGEYTVTGCVATAMAQILKYWNYPVNGSGFHSYNSNNFGTLSADFGSTSYGWSSMPNQLSGNNEAVATLMYHCGVSVDMNYGVGATGGSSAYVVSSQSPVQNCSEYALKTYFGYKSSLQGLMRDNYSLADWISLLKGDIGVDRPVLYAGIGDGGGHCFVCDGFDDNNNFHFNWGWSGQYDGYFAIDALNPSGVGTGGGSGGFNSYQQAVLGLEPETGGGGAGSYDLRLYNWLTTPNNTIYYGAAFDVSTQIANYGGTDFQGDFCAAIFDNNGIYVGMVDSIMNYNLPSTYYADLTFTYPGSFTFLPGSYNIATFFRPNGDNWYLVADGSYSNLISMNVINPNDIELYTPMTASPGTTIIQGQAMGVHLDVVNNGTSDFNGIFDVSLYDLDGYFVYNIGTYTNQTLPVGYHYTNGLDFNIGSLDSPPGTYLLAMQYLESGGSWQLTGSTYYQNPIEITVLDAPPVPDQYEPDNTAGTSYTLPVTFTGNQTTVNTYGSNCHLGSNNDPDYDYYKIDLPAGFSYVIFAQVYDMNHTGGEVYTLDAIFSYSTDGANWSSNFDAQAADYITILNGGFVLFKVSPKFSGQYGTYLLSIGITRNLTGLEESSLSASVRMFPNPAGDYTTIDLSSLNVSVENIRVMNTQGQIIEMITPGKNQSTIKLNVSGYSEGIYCLQFMTSDGMFPKKMIVRR